MRLPLNKVDKLFQNNIKNILTAGSWDKNPRPKWSDDSPAHSKFITQVHESYNLAAGEFPLTSLRKIAWKSAIKEMLWIYQDQSNDIDLLKSKYGISWWDEWESLQHPRTIGLRYGYTVKKFNQIDNLIKEIKVNPESRRLIMTLWDWTDLYGSDGLYPCAYETLWSISDNKLNLTLIQRSSDYLTAGHINKIQYVALQMMIAAECKLELGKFTHFVNNLHIYDRHLAYAEQLVNVQTDIGIPKLILNKKPFYEVNINDFKLIGYEPVNQEPAKLEIAI